MNLLRITAFIVIAPLSASVSDSEAWACAPAFRPGESVHIAEESALIVWDAASKTQHFIRRAQFDTKAKDFGFLVPTPTRPVLSEVDDAVFGHLEALTRPPERPVERSAGGEFAKSAPAPAAAPAVRVLETVTVAGLDAAVLSANDAKALDVWLKGHGYASRPELTEWFKPYIAGKWILTAFKISKAGSPAQRAVSSAVRMSFKTERPYFPYREPATRDSSPRALDVYFVSGERMEAKMGKATAWPGRVLWAQPLQTEMREDLLKRVKLPANAAPATAWLTRFLDRSAPRPGTDELYFSRAADQSQYMDEAWLRAEIARKTSAPRVATLSIPGEVVATREARELMQDGKAAEARGDIRAAVRLYVRATRGGSGEAAKLLGDIFANGKGDVAKDYAESLKYYAIAEKAGVRIDRDRR